MNPNTQTQVTQTLTGMPPVVGVVMGVIIFQLLNYGLSYIGVNPYWQYIIKGGIIVLAVAMDSMKNARRK